MFQRDKLSLRSKIHFVKYFILFSSISTCGSVNIRVGEKAQLDFPYPCDSTVVTLQHANSRPFYRSADPQYMSLSSNQNLVNYTETGHADQCFLNLTINPVSRDDQGTYILTAYKNGVMLPDYPRIYLGVDYLPGKASCEIRNDDGDDDDEWFLLQCSAPKGTLPGHIVCYQNDMRLPKQNKLTESDGNLNQIILARLHVDGVVYCCSSFLFGMKDKCDCTDWGWDPKSNKVSEKAEPCPEVMSTEDPTSTQIVTTDNIDFSSSSSNLETALTKYPKNYKNGSFWIVICTLSVVIFILIIIIMCVMLKYRCTVRKLAHQKGSITQESKEPCLSVKEENVPEHYSTII